jgi:hypothetical protein
MPSVSSARFINTSAPIADSPLVVREASDGMSASLSPHATYEIRFTRSALSGAFVLNRHESCVRSMV